MATNSLSVDAQSNKSGSVFIDSSISKEPTFSFSSSQENSNDFEAKVYTPNGTVIDKNSPYYVQETDTNAIYIAPPYAMVSK